MKKDEHLDLHKLKNHLQFPSKLKIDSLHVSSNVTIGMTHSPGRNHIDSSGNVWTRNIQADLKDIRNWGATSLITLAEEKEFATLGVPNFEMNLTAMNYNWFHLPIPDMHPPGRDFKKRWKEKKEALFTEFYPGKKIIIHCASGLGRTGTLVAKLLTDYGHKATEAIKLVRKTRPGSIETPLQEKFVKTSPPLFPKTLIQDPN